MTLFLNFIRWISAGFLNLICELYSMNICRFFNLICELYSMNICRFFEPYLWTLFNEHLLVFWTLFVSCIDKKIKLKKPADLFDGYLPVFWTLFMNCIYSKNGRFMTLFMNFIRWISAGFWTLFVNCIYSMNICRFSEPYLYWRIQFTNKVKKTSRFLTCIYSMNIAKFLWKVPVK